MREKVEQFIADPKKALRSLSLPIVIGMLVQVLYNIVDTAFVGRLGAEAIAALTFSWPVFFILISLNAGMGAGMNSRLSRYLGEKNKEQAENTAMHGMFLSLTIGLVIFILGNIFLRKIFILFGAQGLVLDYSLSYMRIILVGSLFMYPAFIINYIFSAQGDTKTPMKVQIMALTINMILDPILIYVLGFGVKGAAIATAISFVISLIIYLYLLDKKSYLQLNYRVFKISKFIIKEIFIVGLPATMMMFLMSIYFMFINRLMAYFGVETVAAFGVVSRLDSVAIMPMVGVSAALLTLVAMFYGAKRYDLLKSIIWYAIRFMIIYVAFVSIIFFIMPHFLLMLFTSDKELLALGTSYIRIQVFSYPFIVVSLMISRTMQGMGLGLPGLIINFFRTILISVPLSYTLVYLFNFSYLSVAFSVVVGAVLASLVAIIWLELIIRKLNKKPV